MVQNLLHSSHKKISKKFHCRTTQFKCFDTPLTTGVKNKE